MTLIRKREGLWWVYASPSLAANTPPHFNKAIAEVVLVQHKLFRNQLPLQAFARGPKHDRELSFEHSFLTKALGKRIFAFFHRNQSVAKASLALTAVRVREVSPNPAQETGR